MYKRKNRKYDEIRKIIIEKNVMGNSYSSVLICCGNTKILCSASVEAKTPAFIDENKMGWLTAEYNMLPGSTLSRKSRSTFKPDSRSIEIQRLIARSLRAAIDLTKIKGYSIIMDCDVMQADGGTRTTSITGGYIALELAVKKMLKKKIIKNNPLISKIASISAGIVDGKVLLDIDYQEDSRAEVDFNIVLNEKGEFVEIQGTGENNSFTQEQLFQILETAKKGINELFIIQEHVLKGKN